MPLSAHVPPSAPEDAPLSSPRVPPSGCCSRGPERDIRESKVVVEVGLRPHSGSPDAALPTPTWNPCPLFHHQALPRPPRTSLAIFRTTAKQERRIAEKCIPYDWHRFCESNKNMCDKPAWAVSRGKAVSDQWLSLGVRVVKGEVERDVRKKEESFKQNGKILLGSIFFF